MKRHYHYLKMKNKMKICFIISGNNIFFDRMGEYFVKKGNEIHAVTLHHPENKIKGVNYHFIGEIKPKHIFSNFYKYLTIKRYIKQCIKPDIISAFFITQCGWLGAFIGIHPFILHVMGSDFLLAPRENKLKIPFNNYALRKADVILSESGFLKNGISKIRKTDKNNFVIQFGVKLDLFKPNLNINSLRKELDIANGYVIISPRNNKPLYNHDIVIKAFSEVRKKKPNGYLLLKAQNANKKEELENIAREYGVLDKVRFFGFVPLKELPLYYNLADVFVSVPSSDSVPVTLQEAMACGVPPIVTDLPAVKEWVQDGINGYVVPIRDSNSLANAILKTLDSKNNREEFIKYNLELVKEKSDYFRNMSKIENIYYGLLKYKSIDN